LTVYHFYKRGRHARQMIPGVTHSRYFRLMAIASVDMFGSIPLATYVMVKNARLGVIPWKSWADTHYNYSRVRQIPAFVWKNEPTLAQELGMFRWVLVACAFVFFCIFRLCRRGAPTLSSCVHITRQSYQLLRIVPQGVTCPSSHEGQL